MTGTPLPIAAAPDPAGGSANGPRGVPVLRLGFRPFYLAAASFAVLSIPLWVAVYLGHLELAIAMPPLLWHAHEMLFGFAAAVIIGFLFTATKSWTGLATLRGAPLGALALLWLAARVAAITGPYSLYAVLDLLLLPLVAVALARLMLRAGSHHNLPLAGLLILLTVANGFFHLAANGTVDIAPLAPLYAALALIVMIETVIAGRIVPSFTTRITPGANLKVPVALERATFALTAAALLLWVLAPDQRGWPATLTGALLLGAGGAHAWRLSCWKPVVTRGHPLVWILHISYAWIPLGLGLLAMAEFGWIGVTAGVHGLAIGATGGLIIGMMTRSARGHTGRARELSRLEVAAYVLVIAAAAIRVLIPLALPQWLPAALIVAAAAWSIAFAIYLLIYAPWLLSTRADGKDG